jgi:hypothetical protein
MPFTERKAKLARLLARPRGGLALNEHIEADGARCSIRRARMRQIAISMGDPSLCAYVVAFVEALSSSRRTVWWKFKRKQTATKGVDRHRLSDSGTPVNKSHCPCGPPADDPILRALRSGAESW